MLSRVSFLRLAGSLLALSFSGVSLATDHFIPADRSSFGGSSVNPGDTITLAAGQRGPLTISNLTGSASEPIVIRNDANGSGPTIISRSSGSGSVLECNSCVHVVIDGSSKWRGATSKVTYGIKVTMSGGSPSHFFRIGGLSRNLSIRSVEVDGKWPALANEGIGISVNDHQFKRADHPGIWRENIRLENNYVHNTEGEGMYIGPNWGYSESVDDLPLRNIVIANNIVTDTGWDGIQLKSALEGRNQIHDNVVLRAGSRRDSSAGQHHGISLYESMGEIHHNWVEQAGESGIQHFIHRLPSSFGPMTSRIYNNVVVEAGATGPQEGHGITVGRDGSDDAVPAPSIYNNTVIGTEGRGINVGASVTAKGIIRDNIVAGASGGGISAPSGISISNNRVGTIGSMRFVDAFGMNFRLSESSPARDSGTSSGFPSDDYEGVARPQGARADQGAFEYGDSAGGKPMPPALVLID